MSYTPLYTFVAGNLITAAQNNSNFLQAATIVSDTASGHDHDGTDSKNLSMSTAFGIHPLRYNTFASSTEATTNSTSYASLYSDSLASGANAQLVNFFIKFAAKLASTTSGTSGEVQVMASGATLGTYYLTSARAGTMSNTLDYSPQFFWDTSDASVLTLTQTPAAYTNFVASCVEPLPLPDATTTITVRAKTSAGNIIYLDEIKMKQTYFTSVGTDA